MGKGDLMCGGDEVINFDTFDASLLSSAFFPIGASPCKDQKLKVTLVTNLIIFLPKSSGHLGNESTKVF